MEINFWTYLGSYLISDEEASEIVEASFDQGMSAMHSKTDLYFGEKLAPLSTDLLKEILSYNEKVGNNMGSNLRRELRKYIELRGRPKDYLRWSWENREHHTFSDTGLGREYTHGL